MDEHSSSDEQQQSMANVPQDTFKRWVREMRKIDAEIKEAAPLLSAMRKRKKQLDGSIHEYMKHNGIARVRFPGSEDEFIERQVKVYKKPVNAEHIGRVLEEYFNDEDKAAEVTGILYKQRPEEDREFLKIISAKKRKARAVDGEDV